MLLCVHDGVPIRCWQLISKCAFCLSSHNCWGAQERLKRTCCPLPAGAFWLNPPLPIDAFGNWFERPAPVMLDIDYGYEQL